MQDINLEGTPARAREGAPEDTEPGLLVAERRHRIVDLLREHGRVTVDTLALRFATSPVTIRSDLTALEKSGALERTHGGALLRRDNDDQPLAVKRTLHHAEKVRIAQVAAGLIQDGETIVLDSGTTTAEIAKQIRKLDVRSINVITNALNVATLLTDVPAVRLIMPGGILRPESSSLSGHMAEAALANLQADRLFLGADALDPSRGIMTPHLPEAQLNARMIAISRQVIAVADSSKLMRRNISLIARVEQLHMLITDSGADPAVVEELRRRGVEVRLA
ncbi:MAG: DeoR/GlpR family DNA-binding transcription regulator [Steroidobacteraceae bacterium]|jgi:DeoR family transcriptional regulator of aga operon